jgi:hypothetical protein
MTVKTISVRVLFFCVGLLAGVLFVVYMRPREISFLPIIFTHSPIATDNVPSVEESSSSEGAEEDSLGTDDTSSEAHTDTDTGTHVGITPGGAGENSADLSVFQQKPGFAVIVAHVRIPEEGGWIAIREYHDGIPGSVLGARKVLPGAVDTIEVSLLRETISGSTYLAQVYTDDGNNSFDIGGDIPAADRKPVPFLVQ